MSPNEVTHEVIGAAIAVHRELGPGLLESSYEACLALELAERQVPFDRQWEVPVVYRGRPMGCGYRADFLVDEQVIVELKSVAQMAPIHDAQLLTYLKLSGLHLGLLINFNVGVLREGIRRLVLGLGEGG